MTVTSSKRMAYPIREIQQRPLPLAIVYALNNRYDFASMSSTFCVSLYGLEVPLSDAALAMYNQYCLDVRKASVH